MENLTPQEKAALIIKSLLDNSGLTLQSVGLYHDIAFSKLSPEGQTRLQEMAQGILYNSPVSESKSYSDVGSYNNQGMIDGDTPRMSPIEPNLDAGGGNSVTTGPPPEVGAGYKHQNMIKQAQIVNQLGESIQSLVNILPQLQQLQQLEILKDLNLDSIGSLVNLLPDLQNLLSGLSQVDQMQGNLGQIIKQQSIQKQEGGKKMAQIQKYAELEGQLLKEALKADAKGQKSLLKEIEATILYNKILSKKAEVEEIEKEILKAELKDVEKVASLEQKLAEVRDGIRYLERDYEAAGKFNSFPKQDDEVVTMGYAKAEFNMGDEHVVNPSNVLEPSGKIPDMEQFPSGADKRVEDFKKAKPVVPMAENAKDTSISKVVEGLETVKVLDEKKDIHQKEQPAVPDSLPKLSSKSVKLEKEAQAQVLALLPQIIKFLPVLLEVLPIVTKLIGSADEIDTVLKELGFNVNISDAVAQFASLNKILPQLTKLTEAVASPQYTIKVAGKYEDISAYNLVFPPNDVDPDGHFPIDTVARGRAALAYVNKYTKVPAWAKKRGFKSLDALVKKVVKAVEKKYPGVSVSDEAKSPAKKTKKSAQKIVVDDHDKGVYEAALPCPVQVCDCGNDTFRFCPGSYTENEGYECTECEEFYEADGYDRTPEYGVSDADPGL